MLYIWHALLKAIFIIVTGCACDMYIGQWLQWCCSWIIITHNYSVLVVIVLSPLYCTICNQLLHESVVKIIIFYGYYSVLYTHWHPFCYIIFLVWPSVCEYYTFCIFWVWDDWGSSPVPLWKGCPLCCLNLKADQSSSSMLQGRQCQYRYIHQPVPWRFRNVF